MLPKYHTILCCHGLGPQAPKVLAQAFGLAQAYDAGVIVVHATEAASPQIQHMLDTYLPDGKREEMQGSSRQKVVEEITKQIHQLPEGAGTKHLREIRVVDGRSADTLLEVAREVGADLIVMGTHRHTTMGELLLGSTAHRVAQLSPVAVLLVRLDA